MLICRGCLASVMPASAGVLFRFRLLQGKQAATRFSRTWHRWQTDGPRSLAPKGVRVVCRRVHRPCDPPWRIVGAALQAVALRRSSPDVRHGLTDGGEDSILHVLGERTGLPIIRHGVARLVSAFVKDAGRWDVTHHIVGISGRDDGLAAGLTFLSLIHISE